VNIHRITKARELRRDSSKPERICWELIRAHRLAGIKFRRQHPIGPYFADFVCASRRLVIEIDGEHHAFQVEADACRTAFIESQGWRVLRFWANEVLRNPDGIWAAIEAALNEQPSQPPLLASPPSGGEEYEG
jgi:very-short-patch-repair endonuclease